MDILDQVGLDIKQDESLNISLFKKESVNSNSAKK
jgi:hypothetical protein